MMDTTDAQPYFPTGSGDNRPQAQPVYMGENLSEDFYKMNHKKRGRFIIINNVKFAKETNMNDRTGSNRDADTLRMRFKALDFDVVQYNNVKAKDIDKYLKEAARDEEYNKNADCFGCALLSHGEDGCIYGTDRFIEIDRLAQHFHGDMCKSLAGKPKIFIIQACRGTKCDPGVSVADSDVFKYPEHSNNYRIPALADFVFAYSTVPGYFSWRNSNDGSWFVQAIGRVFEQYGESWDLLKMLTKINSIVGREFQSKTSDPAMKDKKQTPCIQSTLSKQIVFTSKEI